MVTRFEPAGVAEGNAVGALFEEAFAAEAGEETADGLPGEADHAAEVFLVEVHGEGDREVAGGSVVGDVVHAGTVEQGAGELTGGGGVESEAAGGEEGAVVVACNGECGDAAYVGVGFHDAGEASGGN